MFAVSAGGTITLGVIYAATGVGTGFGPLFIRQRFGDGRRASLRAITLGFVLMTAGVTFLGLAPSLGWVIGATLVRGVGTGALWVFSSAVLQRIVEDRFRGRVFAFEFAALTLTQSFSTIVAGMAYDRLGMAVQEVLLVMGGVGLAATAIWLVFCRKVSSYSVSAA